MEKIQKQTLAEVAYEKIKEKIISNEFGAGIMLTEKALCDWLGMSRTPVREALKMLASGDLVEIKDGVGTFVKAHTRKDIEDAYQIRAALELLALKTAIYEISDEDISEMEEAFGSLYKKYKSGEIITSRECEDTDWMLHNMIINRSKNVYLKTAFSVIYTPIKWYHSMSVIVTMHAIKDLEEHIEIVNYIKKRDLKNAERLLKAHISYCG